MILTLFVSVLTLFFAMIAGAALISAFQDLDDAGAFLSVALCALIISSVGLFVLSSR